MCSSTTLCQIIGGVMVYRRCADLNADPGLMMRLDVVEGVENLGEHVPGRLCRGTWDVVTTSWGDVVGKSNG